MKPFGKVHIYTALVASLTLASMGMSTTANAAVTYSCAGAKATIVSAAPSVSGTEGKDVIVLTGTSGQTVNSGGGADVICATQSNDAINSGDGNDTVYGLGGKDMIATGAGNDTVYGGAGNDNISVSTGNDLVYGGSGNDVIDGNKGTDTLKGDGGNDTITGGADADTLYGGVGNDKVYGEAGKDLIKGEDGDDQLFGDADNDVVYGGKGKDAVNGGVGNDTLYGQEDVDTIKGEVGNDKLYGGAGNDVLNGGDGDDTLNGEAGSNKITGGKGKDIKTVGANDTDTDSSAEDTINGDAGTGDGTDSGTTEPVAVPDAVKADLNLLADYFEKLKTDGEITGIGWQNRLPDSVTADPVITSTFKNVTWNAMAETYCATVTKSNVAYRVSISNKVRTIESGNCSDVVKNSAVPQVITALAASYADYFLGALNAGVMTASGDARVLPSTSYGMAPSYDVLTNVKWSTSGKSGKLVISGTLDGVTFYRSVWTFTDGVATNVENRIGVGNTGNLN